MIRASMVIAAIFGLLLPFVLFTPRVDAGDRKSAWDAGHRPLTEGQAKFIERHGEEGGPDESRGASFTNMPSPVYIDAGAITLEGPTDEPDRYAAFAPYLPWEDGDYCEVCVPCDAYRRMVFERAEDRLCLEQQLSDCEDALNDTEADYSRSVSDFFAFIEMRGLSDEFYDFRLKRVKARRASAGAQPEAGQ